jgi:C-terminal binding protein
MAVANHNFRAVVTDLWTDELRPERHVLGDIAVVEALGAHHEEELVGHIEDADALMVNHEVSLQARSIDLLTRCKVIVRAGVGFDNIDFRHARKRGIPVANVPDYGTEEVADSTLAMALSLARGVNLLNSRMRARLSPQNYTAAAPLPRLRDEVFGCVGLGAIGLAVALRAKAIGMRVLCYDPFLRAGYEKAAGVERVATLDELLRQSYIVSLHCGYSRATHHLINAAALAKMRRGAILVNSARGGLVETAAIGACIASGQLAGAALDVIEHDPPRDDDPLLVAWRDPNHPAHHRLIITPHIAFYAEQAMHEQRTKAATACRSAILGQPIPNVVN